jgi:diaminopimelate decarboxylase
MLVDDLKHKRDLTLRLFREAPPGRAGTLEHIVQGALERRSALLALAERFPTPFYAFDGQGLRAALQTFRATFDQHLPRHLPYYAVKSNDHPWLLREAVRAGYGLDVSSPRELALALGAGAQAIIFSGPGKSEADLRLALRERERVIVNIDSFRELERLGSVTLKSKRKLRAGVRIFTRHHGAWSKFGIPLAELGRFFRAAARHPYVQLEGIQFHLSWNRSAEPYARIVEELGKALREQLSAGQRAALRFVDVGGGYKPHEIEGYFPRDHPLGAVVSAVDEHYGLETRFAAPYFIKDSVPLESYAQTLGEAIREHLRPQVECATFTEPGRIISTWAMHLVMRVVDVKQKQLVILDGGIHMVGWERYLHIYAPAVNLTRPAKQELSVQLFGSLCDPEDSFGERCFARSMREGDVIVLPFQGAYTYGVAQDFIRAIPAVRRMPRYREGTFAALATPARAQREHG